MDEAPIRLEGRRNSRASIEEGFTSAIDESAPIARTIAGRWAIRFDRQIRHGVVSDQAEPARLGNVSRARMPRIMNVMAFSSVP